MRVYIITFVLVVILSKLAEDQDRTNNLTNYKYIKYNNSGGWVFYLLSGCILIFVAGFRYGVGSDYWSYYYSYTDNVNDLLSVIYKLDEPGYSLLTWLATRIFNDGAAVIFASSFITISLSLIVIYKNTDQLLLTTVFYLALGCWHGSFNGIRQYLAASIVFCGFNAIKHNQFIQYGMIVLIAFLFHKSALIMLLVFFLSKREISIKNTLLDLVVVAVITIFFNNLFRVAGWIMDKNYSLDDRYAATSVNRIRVISACIPAIIFLIAYVGKSLTELETLYLNISILNAAFCLATMNSALLYRIGVYLAPFQTLAIPQLLKGLSDNNRKFITAGLLIMYLGMWWYELFSYGSYSNFRWIWQR